jgi:D-amino-acid dehydrogenase
MKTLVLGGGVIGTATAYYLAKLGHEVQLVDRQPDVAMETSFGNGGVLHTSEVEPWSRPGMPRNIWRWLGKEDAPMLLRTSALPGMWRWGLSFWRNCTPERYRRHMANNLRLSLYTLQCIKAIREEAGLAYDLMQRGTMKVYTRREALENARAESDVMRAHGMNFEVADARRCIEIEPALAPVKDTLAGGLYYPVDEHGDCHRFTAGLARHCDRALGVKLMLGTEIQRLLKSGDRIEGVETSRGRLTADNYVVAMGSYTPLLLGPVGVRVAIYPAKGVTVTVPASAWPDGPKVPIIDDTRLFGLIRIGDRYRCSGSVEFNGYDRSLNPARARAIVTNVTSVFPQFAKCFNPDTALFWTGLRPMAPSGNPYLGRTRIANLFVNAGHGHLGWTMSCGSGAVVADVVAGRKPQIDTTGFTLDSHD